MRFRVDSEALKFVIISDSDSSEVAIDASGYLVDLAARRGQGVIIIETLGAPTPGTCGNAGTCASGFCVDGQCCDSPCDRPCEACDVAGHVGTCTLVSGAPHGSASAGSPRACPAAPECGAYACDGTSRECKISPPATLTCNVSRCGGAVQPNAGTCQSSGFCDDVCVPYADDCTTPATPKCLTSCASDTQCAHGFFCNSASRCVAKGALGATCPTIGCLSGTCADGVCCDRPCTGPCESCTVPGFAGTCLTVKGAPPVGRPDPYTDTMCAGICDGTDPRSLVYPGATTACVPGSNPSCLPGAATSCTPTATCTSGTGYDVGACDLHGACARPQRSCAPYVCGATTCKTSCATSADCVAGSFCDTTSKCVGTKPNGATCTTTSQCASGQCADGVCCDTACTGQCEACSTGTCTGVNGAPIGARPACASDGTACAGTCIATLRSACFMPGPAVTCRAALCSGGSAQPATVCAGTGSCPAAALAACAPFACAAGSCLTKCTTVADCAAGLTCNASGACVTATAGDAGVDAVSDAPADTALPKCLDGVRSTIEDCDYTPVTGVTYPACSATCRTTDFEAVAPAAGLEARTLGLGAHPLASSAGSLVVAVVEPDLSPVRLGVRTFGRLGQGSGTPLVLAQDGATLERSAPSLAPLADGRVVAVWTDDAIASGTSIAHIGDGDGLGVVAKWFDPSSGATSGFVRVNTTTAFAQHDADVVVAGPTVVIAWVDDSDVANAPDVRFRTLTTGLGATLIPAASSVEQPLSATPAGESSVTLAANGADWIGVWRSDLGGVETLGARDAAINTFSIALAAPGPAGVRPAVTPLDAGRWLVVFVEGTPPGDAGTSDSTRLRYAILSKTSPGLTPSYVLPTSDVASRVNPTAPSLVSVGSSLFVAWQAFGADDDALFRPLAWNATTGVLDTSAAALSVPRLPVHTAGDQRAPYLAWLTSGTVGDPGALALGWDDFGRSLGLTPEPRRDVVLQIAPLPIVRGTP